MPEEQDKDLIIASLMEANAVLSEEVKQLRNTARMLRSVNSAIRSANESLRKQAETAKVNDSLFQRFCGGEFDAKGTTLADGGLPEPRA